MPEPPVTGKTAEVKAMGRLDHLYKAELPHQASEVYIYLTTGRIKRKRLGQESRPLLRFIPFTQYGEAGPKDL